REAAGGLENQVNSHVLPRQRTRVTLGKHAHLVSIHHERVLARLHGTAEPAMHRVVLEKVCERPGIREVIHGHEINIHTALLRRAKHLPSNATETVDPYPNGHEMVSC